MGSEFWKKSSKKNIAIIATGITEEAAVLLSSYQAFIVILLNIIGDHFLLGVWHKSYKLLELLEKSE